MNLKDLTKEIPYKWRVQSFSKNKPQAQCVAYISARDVQDRLDAVVGVENWQDDYKLVDGKLMGGIGIKCGNEWVWKWDTGNESAMDGDKGQISDAFKRAGVKWGIGRFLYDLTIKYVETDGKKGDSDSDVYKKFPSVIDINGKKVWDLTKYINELK